VNFGEMVKGCLELMGSNLRDCVESNKFVLCAPKKSNFFIGKNVFLNAGFVINPLVFIGNLEIGSKISTNSPGFIGIGETR
jgi:hypothetical protein